jgi:hypothetical protein
MGSLLVQALAFGRRSVEGRARSPVHTKLAAMARTSVTTPDAARVSDAPWAPTTGPPIAVPRGVETMINALRAASTDRRFAVVVADWNRECVTGMNGPCSAAFPSSSY